VSRSLSSSSKKKGRRRSIYTRGEVNKLLDSVFHPLERQHWAFQILDELGHLVVEGDPQESIVKFVRYSLPQILRKLMSDDNEDDVK
jgi:hypothetical protein